MFRSHKDIVHILFDRGYKITEDDTQDLNLFVMDLYQGDSGSKHFIISKSVH